MVLCVRVHVCKVGGGGAAARILDDMSAPDMLGNVKRSLRAQSNPATQSVYPVCHQFTGFTGFSLVTILCALRDRSLLVKIKSAKIG